MRSHTGRRGRKLAVPDGGPAPEHPYDVSWDELTNAFESITGRPPVTAALDQTFAWLPSQHGAPLPSSPLVGIWPGSQEHPSLAPWSVRSILLSPADAIDLLCTCGDSVVLDHAVFSGMDLMFWVNALKLAGTLVARQQYLPDIEAVSGRYFARWRPVYTASDAAPLGQLAGYMPPSAFALSDTDDIAPEISPTRALMQVTSNLVDSLVRSAISEPKYWVQKERLSPHGRWLYALHSREGWVRGNKADLSHLAEQVKEWQRPAQLQSLPVRLCFRLEEPVEDDTAVPPTVPSMWYVRYLLQSAKDPSLLVPLEDLWDTSREEAHALAFGGLNLHEYLIYSLGQSARICSGVADSLRSARPSGYHLESREVIDFLTTTAASLSHAGFGVMLPSWWTGHGTKAKLTARATVKSSSGSKSMLSLQSVVDVDWQLALGGQQISVAELNELANLKLPLVKVRGQWVQVNQAEIEAAVSFLSKKTHNRFSMERLVRMSLGAENPLGGVEVEAVDAPGAIGEMLGRVTGHTPFAEMPLPAGFSGSLRPYQLRGYSWLAFLRQYGLGACLADDMGLGKTVQTLALLQHDRETAAQDDRRPVLLVCPTSVVQNWQKEAARFVPGLPVMLHHGQLRARGQEFARAVADQALVVTSFSLLLNDFEQLSKVDWNGIIVDEAQNIKNAGTKQARAVKSLAAGFRVALTGTPVENHVGDLWSILDFLNPGLLGTRERFQREFLVPIHSGSNPEASERLKRITAPFILRRLKTDPAVISDLPEKLESKVFCTLTPEQASLYAAVVKQAEDGLQGLDGIERKGLILATLSKIKQVCNHPAQFLDDNSPIAGRSGKLTRLLEMLEEVVSVRDSALVFTQFARMGEILHRYLREELGVPVYFLHGGVPRSQRDFMVEQFQAGGSRGSVFILSLKAGGTGLNLTRASHVFHYDRWWNPAVENQATDRAFRIGQAKNVLVHKFICAGTLDEIIDRMIEQKKAISASVVGTGEAWLTGLTNQELRDVLALRKETIEE